MKSLSLKDTLASSEKEYEEIIRYVRMMGNALSVIAPGDGGSIFIGRYLKRLVDGEIPGTGIAIPIGKVTTEGLKDVFSIVTSQGTTDERLIAIAMLENASLSCSHLTKRPGINFGFDQMVEPLCNTNLLIDLEQALISAREYVNGTPQSKQLDGPIEIQVKKTSTWDDDALDVVTWEKDDSIRFIANHGLHGGLYSDLHRLAGEMMYQWSELPKEQQEAQPWIFGVKRNGRMITLKEYLLSTYPNVGMFDVDKFEEIVKNDPKLLSIKVGGYGDAAKTPKN